MPGRKRILVVEDDPDFMDFVRISLACEGYELTLADKGANAEFLLKEKSKEFDLVLTDHVFVDAARTRTVIQSAVRHRPGTPIIAMSGRPSETDRLVALAQGARDYLPKPFERDQLMRAVWRAFGADQENHFDWL